MIVEIFYSFKNLEFFRLNYLSRNVVRRKYKKIQNVVDIKVNATKIVSFVQFGMFGDIPN